MTTDWWSVASREAEDSPPAAVPPPVSLPEVEPTPERPAEPPRRQAPEEPEPTTPSNSGRGKAMKVVGAAAGVVVAGILVAQGISGAGGNSEKPPASVSASQGEDLPAAGGGPENALPAAGGGQPSTKLEQQSPSPAPKVVTLKAAPSGKGRVGAMVSVTIHNGTDEPVTVLATMMKGDGRPAIVGEGTLAPGSRTVQPGETVTGTVEFSTAAAPHQVALLDWSGNIVAASN